MVRDIELGYCSVSDHSASLLDGEFMSKITNLESSAHLDQASLAHRLVLIDGNAILHRAYHALPPLTTPDGSLVNAVYGFTSILIKIFNDLKPTHMAVAFDRPEPTFRKKIFADYQAKRPEMEEGLVSQIPKIQDVVRAFGIPIYDAAGFEADDVIGSLVKQATDERKISRANLDTPSGAHPFPEVIIVTGDRDLLQLVDDMRGIKVFMPTKGLSEGKLYGEKDVVEKMGVPPKHIPDLKALMGDASDNYPGVAGIGPKTAVKLITTYGSIEEMYKKVKGKRKKEKGEDKLLGGEENAKLSKDLATIRTDVPVAAGELAPITTLDTPEGRAKLEALHFPSLLKRLKNVKEKIQEKTVKKVKKRDKSEKQTRQQDLF